MRFWKEGWGVQTAVLMDAPAQATGLELQISHSDISHLIMSLRLGLFEILFRPRIQPCRPGSADTVADIESLLPTVLLPGAAAKRQALESLHRHDSGLADQWQSNNLL